MIWDVRTRRAVARAMRAWFAIHARPLPWRAERTAYRVWISEIMAQQTRIETVVPYFTRFVARFPGVDALATAPLDEVLTAWSGLGYYRRARHLHAAAKTIVERFGGELPRTAAQWQALPGVGRYTAGAIASIAFGERAAVLDGNVTRVLARILACEDDVRRSATRSLLWRAAEELLPDDAPGAFNESLMELGALVCTPAAPACAICPVGRWCRALQKGIALSLPVKSAGRPPRAVRLLAAAMTDRQGRVLLCRQPAGGWFGGLWALPQIEAGGDADERLNALALDTLGFAPRAWRPVGHLRYLLTHRKLEVDLFRAEAPRAATGRSRRWVRPDDPGEIALSTFTRRLLAQLARS